MKNITTLTGFEIETKVGAAVRAELSQGVKASDLSRTHMNSIVERVRLNLSPSAREALIYDGLLSLAKKVLGSKIANEVWATGKGWSISEEDIIAIGAKLKIEDAVDCFESFREGLMDFTVSEAADFPALARFMPLFVMQANDATLGEIATRKAVVGDKLSRELLSWKELVA